MLAIAQKDVVILHIAIINDSVVEKARQRDMRAVGSEEAAEVTDMNESVKTVVLGCPWELERDDVDPSEELTGIHARAFELQTALWFNYNRNAMLEEDRLDELAETDWEEYIYSTQIEDEDLL